MYGFKCETALDLNFFWVLSVQVLTVDEVQTVMTASSLG